MSVYESISKASLKSKRRLFDFNVGLLGQKMKAIRISVNEDIFHDTDIEGILSSEKIEVIIRFPSEMPLHRYRLGSQEKVEETRTYFYDILPIEGYSKLEDHIEKNDFIFFFLEDEKYNKIPFLLQAVDSFGKFEIGLVWKKHYFAPYHGELEQSIISYLEEFVISDYYDSYTEENPDSSYLSTEEELTNYVSEDIENLFPYPLNPVERSVTLEPGDYVVQCAFGSFLIDQTEVTPTEPKQFTVEEEETLMLYPSSDCRFPSIYKSNYFHPFVYDDKTAYYFSFLFNSGEYNFETEFIMNDKESIGTILFNEDFSIISYTDPQEDTPIFYIEDGDGKFILFKRTYNKEFIAEGLLDSSFSHSFGIIDQTKINFSILYNGDTINLTVEEISYTIENCSIFNGKEIFIGYEPERYLNDFVKQVYL